MPDGVFVHSRLQQKKNEKGKKKRKKRSNPMENGFRGSPE